MTAIVHKDTGINIKAKIIFFNVHAISDKKINENKDAYKAAMYWLYTEKMVIKIKNEQNQKSLHIQEYWWKRHALKSEANSV